HPDLDRICRKLPIKCQVPANASTTFRFKPLLHRALRIFQTRLNNQKSDSRVALSFERFYAQSECEKFFANL
ncbi:hypothetical protein, partial [Paraburkholderia sp. BR13444]|uniref:hypothetical protein n=1 Tax=Paraburkholderia sp. BR13444 TaxID=3236997 RepID=UPI0034CDD937